MIRIRKVLIANRGEIAVRIMRTAKMRGIKTVAVFSDADAHSLHVRRADEAVYLGGAAPSESYLNVEAILKAAKETGADAIHPGYGFLSERASFAEACANAGIVFIGPPASAIAAMGDKAISKRWMIAARVPCVPGYQGADQSDEAFAKEAAAIGFPVMVKASAGGGGRGMRLVENAADLKEASASARKEAESAFGDGRLLLEKAITGAHHVEIQVMADTHGNIVHLGERDCSLQRRRQKVIEESPSPVITRALRASMGAAAVEAARTVGYVGAGTVEFLFDPKTHAFYFLEMNTRLQVEHAVTEMVAGLDLVGLQFDVAEGAKLPMAQEDVHLYGWAMEARLYAEDPAHGFLPQTGRIAALEFPESVRVDSGVEAGDEVSSHYDPMIAKVIAAGETRKEARLMLADAIEKALILGLKTNAPFLLSLLCDETFAEGKADTNYIESNLERLTAGPPVAMVKIALAAAALAETSPGALLTGWNSRGDAFFPMKLQHGDEIIEARACIRARSVIVERGGIGTEIEIISIDHGRIRYRCDDRICTGHFSRSGAVIDVKAQGTARRFIDLTFAPASEAGLGSDIVKAPMAGAVTSVAVKAGDTVTKGDTVATIEAMKMEHKLAAPRDGIVESVAVAVGDQVAIRSVVVSLKTAEATA